MKYGAADSHENCYNYCHQMSDFKAKIHPNRVLAGALPQTSLGELTVLSYTP